MSVNRYLPHVLVLPEDDADRQLANGFLLNQDLLPRTIQVLEEAGGWNEVVKRFLTDHVAEMARYPKRSMILVIDFDGDLGRLNHVKNSIPDQLTDRVYVIGALNEPEDLRRAALGSYENIGLALAKDCRTGTNTVWGHAPPSPQRGRAGPLTPKRSTDFIWTLALRLHHSKAATSSAAFVSTPGFCKTIKKRNF